MLALDYLPALESLGDDYYDIVATAEFPRHILRFRNDDVVRRLGLDPSIVSDENFIAAFGKFQGRAPFLGLRYQVLPGWRIQPLLGQRAGLSLRPGARHQWHRLRLWHQRPTIMLFPRPS